MDNCIELLKSIAERLPVEQGYVVVESLRLRNMLSSIEYNAIVKCIKKLHNCVIKDVHRSTRRYPVWLIDMACVTRVTDVKETDITLADLLELAKSRFESSPWSNITVLGDAFYAVYETLKVSDKERINVLLLGEPGTGKSLILSFFEHEKAPLFLGATTSPKTLLEYLMMTQPVLIIFDEIDKAEKRTIDAILNMLTKGRLVMLTRHGKFDVQVDAPFLAAANSFELKRSVSWTALQDRFVIIEMRQPSRDDIERIVNESIDDYELQRALISAKISLRQLHMLISLYKYMENKTLAKRIILSQL